MQNIDAIIRWPMWIGLLLSIVIHVAMLNNRSFYTPPRPQMATGRTVVQLTLLPTSAGAANPPATINTPAHEGRSPQPKTMPVEAEIGQEPVIRKSIEQEASLEEEKGVVSSAVATGTFHPAYPRISKRRGEEGTVILSVRVLANGSVGKAEILQSSGFRRLDDTAMQGALQTTFTPAVRMGRPVESTTRLSYTFRLTDD